MTLTLEFIEEQIKRVDLEVKRLKEKLGEEQIEIGSRYQGLLLICCSGVEGNEEIISKLVNRGVDVNTTTVGGNSPLHLAVSNNYFSAAQALLKNGAEINLFNHQRECPLYFALNNDNSAIIELLISNGAQRSLLVEADTNLPQDICEKGQSLETSQLIERLDQAIALLGEPSFEIDISCSST